MSGEPYAYAIRLLAAREYTTRNLRQKLVRKGFPTEEIEAAVERLSAAQLLDDARFASVYARQKLVIRGSSVRRVHQDLARMGIAREEATAAIDRVVQDEPIDVRRSIESAAKKKLASMSGLDHAVKKRRLFAFLARRGFEVSDIRRVVGELAGG